MELRRWKDDQQIYKQVRRGWALGSEEFRAELLAAMTARNGERVSGDELRESGEQRAQRILREQLRKLGWTRRDLTARRKGDPRKLKIARRLREETTVPWSWLAPRLHAGVWRHLANQVRNAK